jgi:type II secretory pathway pseudopilin PulG
MKGYKIVLIVCSVLAVGGLGFWLYEKQRVKKLNEKVDSLEDALKALSNAKKGL